jgi:3'-phosphoadenosine 5'-phosphosulfate sulfotransferase (PAPS reductase)/FAD synthetase
VRHVLCFSGGKDSTALILWARENLSEFATVFCDTGWEHPITYAYIEEINQKLLGGRLVTLTSTGFPAGMRDLVQIRGRVPSAKARFCTDTLKVRPMIDWLRTINDEITVYQGIRADESSRRSAMAMREWSDDYDAWVERPLLAWTAAQCFALMAKYGIKPNPLYLFGAGRVGCFPCVMINMRELKALLDSEVGPELKRRVLELEDLVGTSFFEPTYIPERFCTGFDKKSGKRFAWAGDVFKYIESVHADQMPLLPRRACLSVYNLCE